MRRASVAEHTRTALAVRRAVAKMGRVNPQFIHPDDEYPRDLAVLPHWDSLDFLELVFALEEELGIAINAEMADRLRKGCRRAFSVNQLAWSVIRSPEDRPS